MVKIINANTKIKEDLNSGDISGLQIGRLNIIKISILSNMINKFNVIPG